MADKIAICGLDCGTCSAYLATQKDDDAERKKVAETWSKEYGADIKPEDINCEGCTSKTGPYFSHCNVCEIRKCGLEQNVENCAHCEAYACDKLTKFFDMVPVAKTTLDGVKAGLDT